MALEIKPTEMIFGEGAEEFMKRMEEVDENPGTEVLEFPEIDIGE